MRFLRSDETFGFGASQSDTLDGLSRGDWMKVAVATCITMIYDGLKCQDYV